MIKESSFDDSFLYTEGYRSGHNEAVLKNSRSAYRYVTENLCGYWIFGCFAINVQEVHLAKFLHY